MKVPGRTSSGVRKARRADVQVTTMSLSPHRREVGARPHVELERGRHLLRQPLGGLAIDIPDMHPLELDRRRDRRELDAALHARAADRRHARVAARQMAGRQRGGRAGAVDGDLDRIHHGERPAVDAVGQVDDALHRRQAVGRRIAGEVAVELDGHFGVVRPAARHPWRGRSRWGRGGPRRAAPRPGPRRRHGRPLRPRRHSRHSPSAARCRRVTAPAVRRRSWRRLHVS